MSFYDIGGEWNVSSAMNEIWMARPFASGFKQIFALSAVMIERPSWLTKNSQDIGQEATNAVDAIIRGRTARDN